MRLGCTFVLTRIALDAAEVVNGVLALQVEVTGLDGNVLVEGLGLLEEDVGRSIFFIDLELAVIARGIEALVLFLELAEQVIGGDFVLEIFDLLSLVEGRLRFLGATLSAH